MRYFRRVLIAVACLAGVGPPTAGAADFVASLSALAGNVFVTQATKAVRAQDGMPLRPGDRISLLQGARLTVVYANGCRVTLSGASTVTIGAMPSCATQPANSQAASSQAENSVPTISFPLPPPARRASR